MKAMRTFSNRFRYSRMKPFRSFCFYILLLPGLFFCLGSVQDVLAVPTDEEKAQWLFENCDVVVGFGDMSRLIRMRSPSEGLDSVVQIIVVGTPPKLIEYLSNIPNLEILSFHGTQLDSVDFLTTLPSLRHLSFIRAQVIKDEVIIGGLDELEKLTVVQESHQDTWINSIPRNLTHLDLKNIYVGRISDLHELEKIEELHLGNVTGFQSLSLIGMIKLKNLEIDQCWNYEAYPGAKPLESLIPINDLSVLANLFDLQALSICNFPSLDNVEFLSSLTQLRLLSISGCPLIDDICPAKDLHQLNTLTLSRCPQISEIGCLRNLPKLRIFLPPSGEIVTDVPEFFRRLDQEENGGAT